MPSLRGGALCLDNPRGQARGSRAPPSARPTPLGARPSSAHPRRARYGAQGGCQERERERERERQDFLLMPCSAPPRPPKLGSAPILAALSKVAYAPGPTRRGATDSSRRNQPISRPDPSPPPRPAQIQPIISPHTAQSPIQDQIP